MATQDIGVLIVDDSALMRNLISKIVEGIPGLVVAGRAMNGQFALDKIPVCKPDVIVLDIEMPVMDGLEFLRERKRRGIDIPVIMLSSLTTEGASVTMQCLELGASDFLTKPGGPVGGDLSVVANRLAELLPSYGGQYAKMHGNKCVPMYQIPTDSAAAARQGLAAAYGESLENTPKVAPVTVENLKPPVTITPLREPGRIDIIAIGISTGGPNALREVFRNIDPNLKQPILVVQHMPAGFTEEFAHSLNNICPLEVKEAHDGDILKSGRILIAPGNNHIYVEKKSLATVVRLSDAPQRNGHRPSADVLFESVAALYQNHALGVIMTGMGNDGAAQLAEMRRQGAHTLGQDEQTCIVYGMPKVAWEMGGVQRKVSLQDMANAISKLARDFS
ncbi:MAG: chemotaxis response regulator protein-glutamate methylesterase [Spirochaetaceae bacterium]|nr:chemotaxis response regulator protein-glutamate methylesterase [Spirochaetaceae bacterium]